MNRQAISFAYVGAPFLASFAVIVLIAGGRSPAEISGFFLFQAVFLPITALMSQTRMLMRYQGSGFDGWRTAAMDLGVIVVGYAALMILSRGMFSHSEAWLFALSIPLSYRGAQALVEMQFTDPRARTAVWPIASAGLRILAAWAALSYGPAPAFAASAMVGWLIPSLVNQFSRHVTHSRNLPGANPATPRKATLFLAFFAVSAISFQWDRWIFGLSGQTALISASGLCMTWMLAPISTAFATCFRADARSIFAPGTARPKRRDWLRRARVFVILAVLWLGAVTLLWGPLNARLFPQFNVPLLWPLLLGAAIIIDRIANLGLFLLNDPSAFAAAMRAKIVILLPIAATLALSHAGVVTAYSLMLTAALAHLALVAWRYR